MRAHTMRIAILTAAALAGAAQAWVGEEELPGPVAKLRTQYRTEFEKGMAPIVAKCRQALETQLKAASMRRSGSEIALMKELLELLAAGLLSDDRMRAASSKVPREVQITCRGYEGERERLITGLKRRHLAELARVGQSLKTAGDANGASVAAREAADLEAGEMFAWGLASRLARQLSVMAWSWEERRVRFNIDGTVDGDVKGTWKQTGPHSLRARVTGSGETPRTYEASLSFSEDLHGFEATDTEKNTTSGHRVRRD